MSTQSCLTNRFEELATLSDSDKCLLDGRRKGVERLVHFLLELRIRKRCREDSMELPLNQSVIGDAHGMSSVHVSRSMTSLRKLGLLSTNGNHFSITDMDAAANFCGFCPKYLDAGSTQH